MTNSDCDELKAIILSVADESTLESAIYIYGRSCRLDRDVLEICRRYLVDQPVPGLTAVCMRTALDYWGLWEEYPEVLNAYLNIDLYDEWYDEVLFACRFCSELTADQRTTHFASRLADLLDAAKKKGIAELAELGGAKGDFAPRTPNGHAH
jgi:hypothetical protein